MSTWRSRPTRMCTTSSRTSAACKRDACRPCRSSARCFPAAPSPAVPRCAAWKSSPSSKASGRGAYTGRDRLPEPRRQLRSQYLDPHHHRARRRARLSRRRRNRRRFESRAGTRRDARQGGGPAARARGAGATVSDLDQRAAGARRSIIAIADCNTAMACSRPCACGGGRFRLAGLSPGAACSMDAGG